MKESINLLSCGNSLLDQWYESWSRYFLYDDAIIQYMDSLSIHATPYCRVSREDSDLSIASLDHCLCSWNRHSEDMSIRIDISLEPAESMDTRRIAGEDDDICPTSKEPINSGFRENSYLIT